METKLIATPIETAACDAAVILTFEDTPGEHLAATVKELYDAKEYSGKSLESVLLHRPEGFAARRVLLLGGGKKEKFTPAELRKAAGAAVRTLKPKSLKKLALLLESGYDSAEHVGAAVEGAILGNFEPDQYKSDRNGGKIVDALTLVVPEATAALDAALQRGRILAEAQNYTRELVNEPSNRLNPTILADRARQMANQHGLECEVLDEDRMRALGMGALLGVSQGSAQPPALIVLRYQPAGAKEGVHLGLVGKGVTFDSGGLSLKPADGMEKMKYDMAGGAAVIGAMRAIAQLGAPIQVTGLIPAVENMTGSGAQRPGDIVTSMSGKTIEVLNTDAEGRLILSDALTYARQLGCTHLIDAATLTGAIAVALGHIYMGLFASDDAFRQRVQAAAAAEGERMWHLPLDDDYKDYLKSAFADLPNIGGRYGGSITAAYFLKEFASPTPWVHLDIANTAWLDDAKPFLAKGPSGVTVRTFVRLATDWSD
jgi:leucyl aminopeptidase